MRDLKEAIDDAREAIGVFEADDPLREIAFKEVLRARLTSITNGSEAASSTVLTPTASLDRPDELGALGRAAQRLGLPVETLARVFDFSGDRANILIESSQLRSSKAGGTEDIALLLCAARQAGLGETETTADVIRRTCAEFGRLDDPNFATALRGLGGALVSSGSSRARTYRMTRPGFERARRLIEALTSRPV